MMPLRQLGRLARTGVSLATREYLNLTWRRYHREAKAHHLPGRLALTLTSYPPRFRNLALTLRSLLAQSVQPDSLLLWIARSDFARLPNDVIRLQTDGLLIRTCDDLRSYKKIIPALESRDADFLVIADDDVYYPRDWLREIVSAYRPNQKEVVCGRAHRIVLDARGMPLPYAQWQGEVPAGEPSSLLFPTGIGGVLYTPDSFHPDVTRVETFLRLCPTADDIWLYWMAALNGARFRKVGPRRQFVAWLNTQHVALFLLNSTSNDLQIANMLSEYGVPYGVPS
jgi:hypothetical protein